MKSLFVFALVALVAFPLYASDCAGTVPAPAPDAAIAEAVPGPTTLKGQVIITRTEGQPDVVTFQTADAVYTLLPSDKLTALLAVADVTAKTFKIEGEKVPSRDGKTAGFMVKAYTEKAAAPACDAPCGRGAPCGDPTPCGTAAPEGEVEILPAPADE